MHPTATGTDNKICQGTNAQNNSHPRHHVHYRSCPVLMELIFNASLWSLLLHCDFLPVLLQLLRSLPQYVCRSPIVLLIKVVRLVSKLSHEMRQKHCTRRNHSFGDEPPIASTALSTPISAPISAPFVEGRGRSPNGLGPEFQLLRLLQPLAVRLVCKTSAVVVKTPVDEVCIILRSCRQPVLPCTALVPY